ncbi:MAG: hypothetical protein H7288_18130 [Kineosporiaceae bacterium]|nr:hypothetical protein [Aeromicrobium sp.]
MPEIIDLSQELTRLVRTIPGVEAVYATRPLANTLVSLAVRTLTGAPIAADLVSVQTADAGITISASIGTSGDEPAPVTASRVHDAIVERLTELGVLPVSIDVRIGSVGY